MSSPPGQTWVESSPALEPYRYGLLSVAQISTGAGSWQTAGVEYFTDACAQGGHVIGSCPQPTDPPDPPNTTHTKPIAEGLNLVHGTGPMTVYARAECNAVAFTDPQGAARRRLTLIENREVERFFSIAALGAPDPRYPLGEGAAAVPLMRGLGVLEQDAALFYGGAPTLHSPRWTQPYFSGRSLLQSGRDTQPVLRTHLDSRVAFGGGYLDNPFDPDTPAAADTFWLVATGSVRAFRSEVFVNETFTPATNIRMALAERTYALDADCYRAAVLVTVAGEN